MEEKILYILGAGASAKALPLARSIFKEGKRVVAGLAFDLSIMSNDFVLMGLSDELTQYQIDVKKRFRDLSIKADEFGDVDTYAKYLNLMSPGGDDIVELKRTLSEYFSIKQNISKARDRRYLPWIVSLMDKRKFPENVKIVSWNYDFQVQLASAQIGDLESIEHKQNSFTYSPPFISYYPNIDPTFKDFAELSMVQLNGTAGIVREGLSNTSNVFQKNILDDPKSTLEYLYKNQSQNQMHFAWERNGHHERMLEKIDALIDGVTILVVIGYSFPFFNRDVDKKIFNKLNSTGHLRKIYYQDPVLDGQQLKSQFGLSSGFPIIHIANTDNFHIPFEY